MLQLNTCPVCVPACYMPVATPQGQCPQSLSTTTMLPGPLIPPGSPAFTPTSSPEVASGCVSQSRAKQSWQLQSLMRQLAGMEPCTGYSNLLTSLVGPKDHAHQQVAVPFAWCHGGWLWHQASRLQRVLCPRLADTPRGHHRAQHTLHCLHVKCISCKPIWCKLFPTEPPSKSSVSHSLFMIQVFMHCSALSTYLVSTPGDLCSNIILCKVTGAQVRQYVIQPPPPPIC